jgi:phage baseplate assembly protein W
LSQQSSLGTQLGTDIRFDFDSMDISIEGSGITTVSGKSNLNQAISLRLMTRIGSLPFHQNYGSGLSQLIGRSNSPGLIQIAKMFTGQALMREPRILYVEDIMISAAADSVIIDIAVHSTDGVSNIQTQVVS